MLCVHGGNRGGTHVNGGAHGGQKWVSDPQGYSHRWLQAIPCRYSDQIWDHCKSSTPSDLHFTLESNAPSRTKLLVYVCRTELTQHIRNSVIL